MASGDVILETTGDGLDVLEYYKQAPGAPAEKAYSVKASSTDSDDFYLQLELKGDPLGGIFPNFVSSKKYKIKITEV